MSHQTSVDESRRVTDECRRMQTSADKSLDECRRVQTNHQKSVDDSLDKCKQMQTSVDGSKKFSSIPLKMIHGPILLLLQLGNSRPHRYAIFNFVVLSVITAPHNVLTPHTSETHLTIVSFNVRELPAWGWKPNSP